MPRARAPGRRARLQRKEKPRPADVVWQCAFDMDEPLHDAINYVHALNLMGQALIGTGAPDEGNAIFVVTRAALDRLDEIHTLWRRLFKAAGEGTQ
jgi:hypothetical protein